MRPFAFFPPARFHSFSPRQFHTSVFTTDQQAPPSLRKSADSTHVSPNSADASSHCRGQDNSAFSCARRKMSPTHVSPCPTRPPTRERTEPRPTQIRFRLVQPTTQVPAASPKTARVKRYPCPKKPKNRPTNSSEAIRPSRPPPIDPLLPLLS